MTGAYVKFETKPILQCLDAFLISCFACGLSLSESMKSWKNTLSPAFSLASSTVTLQPTVFGFGNPDCVGHFSKLLVAHYAIFFVSLGVGCHELFSFGD